MARTSEEIILKISADTSEVVSKTQKFVDVVKQVDKASGKLKTTTTQTTEAFGKQNTVTTKTKTTYKDLVPQVKKTNSAFGGLTKTMVSVAKSFLAYRVVLLMKDALVNTIKVAAEFESSMAKVKAISGATDSEFKALTKSARDLAKGTIFTANQVAELQLAYSKLGFTTQEILDATEATLNLATATGEDLAGAADVVGATIRGFGLDAEETSRVVDVMAKAFSSSALNLEHFKQSMKTVAPIANSANIDLETTTSLLGVLADSGLRGTRAATGLKNIMSKLTDPTSDLAKELGFTVKGAEGLIHAFREMSARGIDLSKATELVDERSKAAFITLVNGTSSVEDLRMTLDTATGSARTMASVVENTLTGSFKMFQSQVEETQIAVTNSDFLKESLDFLSFWIVAFRDGMDDARKLRMDLLVSDEVKEQMASILEEEKKFFDKRKESRITFAEENERIMEEADDKEKASALIRERSLKKRKEDEESLIKFLEEQQDAISDKQLALTRKNEKLMASDFAERRRLIKEDIALQEERKVATVRDINDRRLKLQILKVDLEKLNEEEREHQETISQTKDYVEAANTVRKLQEIKDDLSASTEDLTGRSEDLQDQIDELNKSLDTGYASLNKWVGELERVQSFPKDPIETLAPEELSDNLDAVKKSADYAADSMSDFIETLEEGEEIPTKYTKGLEKLGDSMVALLEEETELRAMQDAINSFTDLYIIGVENRLNALISANEQDMQSFIDMQDEKLKKEQIYQDEESALFIGSQEEKAIFERQQKLEMLEFEKRQQLERDKLAEKQLAKENEIAEKAFKANQKNALANIAINTAIAIAKAPAEGLILGYPALVALLSASAAAQAATVLSQQFQPKTFEDGGMIVGPSHSEGGVPFTVGGRGGFEAEGGEFIMSRKSVDRLGVGFLNALNSGQTMFRDGGAVPSSVISGASAPMNNFMASLDARFAQLENIMSNIKVTNVAVDTTGVSSNVQNAQSQATF